MSSKFVYIHCMVCMINAIQCIRLSPFQNSSQNATPFSALTKPAASCPPGLFHEGDSCTCGVYPYHAIMCFKTYSFILKYHCATYDEGSNETLVVGSCLYHNSADTLNSNGTAVERDLDFMLYDKLPDDVNKLNDIMCKRLNRGGTLCGSCLKDHYPLAYSFNMTCIRCPNFRWNWFRYIMAAFLPLIILYMVVVFFKLHITTGHLFAIVYTGKKMKFPATAVQGAISCTLS